MIQKAASRRLAIAAIVGTVCFTVLLSGPGWAASARERALANAIQGAVRTKITLANGTEQSFAQIVGNTPRAREGLQTLVSLVGGTSRNTRDGQYLARGLMKSLQKLSKEMDNDPRLLREFFEDFNTLHRWASRHGETEALAKVARSFATSGQYHLGTAYEIHVLSKMVTNLRSIQPSIGDGKLFRDGMAYMGNREWYVEIKAWRGLIEAAKHNDKMLQKGVDKLCDQIESHFRRLAVAGTPANGIRLKPIEYRFSRKPPDLWVKETRLAARRQLLAHYRCKGGAPPPACFTPAQAKTWAQDNIRFTETTFP